MSVTRIRTFQHVPQRLRVEEDFSTDVWSYGYQNTYPQQIQQILFASGVASGAVELFSDFIFGEGFEDEELAKTIVNDKGQTANDILELYASERAIFKGASFHCNYNLMLEKTDVTIIPFQYCRIARPETPHANMIAVYDNWANEAYDKNQTIQDIDYIDLYTNDIDTIEQQIERAEGFENWKGQILYHSCEGFLKYPKCTFDPVINDVQTDALYSTYRKRSGQNNFNPSAVFDFMGDYEEQDKQNIIDSIKDNQGSENAGEVMCFFGDNTDSEGNKVKNVEISYPTLSNTDSIYVNQEKSVNTNITRMYKQPKVLVAMDDSGLFNQDQMVNAYTFYNEVTKKQRMEASRLFEKIFENFEGVTSTNFTIKAKKYGEQNVTNLDG